MDVFVRLVDGYVILSKFLRQIVMELGYIQIAWGGVLPIVVSILYY